MTLRALKRLSRVAERAKSEDEKAAALYRLASYYYTHRPLLLYSPQLWHGYRALSFSYSWNPEVAERADDEALARHHNEHECLAHALRICQQIVKEFPKTSVAGKAAYRGACAAEKLGNMAPYWRWVNYHKDLDGEAVRLMRLAQRDPNLRKDAVKYSDVFAVQRKEERGDETYNKTLSRPRWNPRWEER